MVLELWSVCVRRGLCFPTHKVLPLVRMLKAPSFTGRSTFPGTWTKVVFNHHVYAYLRGNNLEKIPRVRTFKYALEFEFPGLSLIFLYRNFIFMLQILRERDRDIIDSSVN